MKKRLWISALLIASMTLIPHQRLRAQPQKPQWVIPVVCGVIVIGVGAWVTYSLYKMCQKIPNQKPDDQQDPNAPPAAPHANAQPKAMPSVTMQLPDASGVLYWDCSTNGWTDPVSGGPVTQIMKTRLQSTVDFQTWTDELALLGYCSDNGTLIVYSRGGVPVLTNYLTFGTTNVLNFNGDGAMAPHKFYRLAAP